MQALFFLGSHDTSGGSTYEINDCIPLGARGNVRLDIFERLGGVHTIVINNAVDLLDCVDLLRCETATVESDRVDTGISNRFAGGYDIRRDVFVNLRSALNHHMGPDAAELMHKCATADDREVIDLYLTCQLRAIRHNNVVMQDAIMRDMAVRHDQIVGTDDGFSFGSRTAMDGDELTEDTVIADDGPGLFAAELQVLGDTADDSIGKDMAIIAENHIIIDIGERIYRDVLADLSLRAHIS